MSWTDLYSAVMPKLMDLAVLAIFVLVMLATRWAKNALLSYCQKNNINMDNEMLFGIESVVRKIVSYVNQTFVDKLKETNPDGHLTDDEKQEAFNKAAELFELVLNNNPDLKSIVETNYGTVQTGAKIMIENAVAEANAFKGATISAETKPEILNEIVNNTNDTEKDAEDKTVDY